MKTLRVPAKVYDEALRFCNRRRKSEGLPPWDKLPAGRATDPRQCPCGQAVPGLCVDTESWDLLDPNGRTVARGDDVPEDFIAYFDRKVGPMGPVTLPIRGLKP